MSRLDSFRDDTRAAISFNIAIFFASIAIAFFLYVLLEPAAATMLDLAATNTESQAAADGQQYVNNAWASAHLLIIAAGALQLIVAAVYQERSVGI